MAFEGASRIAAWHLNESRRFFGELALPAELADAARLDSWLIEYCRRERTHLVATREAQRLGPIRDKEKLTTALRELEELDRVKVAQEGRAENHRGESGAGGGDAMSLPPDSESNRPRSLRLRHLRLLRHKKGKGANCRKCRNCQLSQSPRKGKPHPRQKSALATRRPLPAGG